MPSSGGLLFSDAAWAEMWAHVERDKPREAVGALIGAGGSVVMCHPLTNTEKGTEHYAVDAFELVRLHMLVDDLASLDVLGFYHSHPRTSSEPSDLDWALAQEGYLYVVCGADGNCTTFSV